VSTCIGRHSLRTATHLGEGDDDVEAGHGEEGKEFQGAVVIMEGKNPKEAEEMAKAAALEWTGKRNTAWTDGSRLENQKVGCAVVWQEEAGDDTTPQTIHQEYSKENGGWKTTFYHPHQSGGREGGTWDKGFGNKATPSSRKPNTTDGPGRIPSWDKRNGVRRRIICHLPSSHAVRKTAQTRPRIHHICRLAGSDEEVSDRPPGVADCADSGVGWHAALLRLFHLLWPVEEVAARRY